MNIYLNFIPTILTETIWFVHFSIFSKYIYIYIYVVDRFGSNLRAVSARAYTYVQWPNQYVSKSIDIFQI